jgi:predicted dehydrogenase
MSDTPIKTGICSYGMSGKLFHAPFIQAHPGFELTAIVERHKTDSRTLYPNSILYKSVDELIADSAIELIVVNTPVQTHFEFAKAAILAGKSVVVEKAFTVTVAEAKKLRDLAKEKNVFLSVYQNRRYDADYLAVKRVVSENLLGELKEVEIKYDRYRPGLSGKLHKEADLPGAGVLHDLGPHLIDQALQLFGKPTALFADIRVLRKQSPSNDYFELLLYYPTLRVRLKSSILALESGYAYSLHGAKGSFLQERSDVQEKELLKGTVPSMESWCKVAAPPTGVLHVEKDGQFLRELTNDEPGNYMNYYKAIWEALRNKGANPVPASEAVQTMKIIEAAMESNAQGRVVDL